MKKASVYALLLTAALTGSLFTAAHAEEAEYVYEDDNIKIGQYVGLTYSAVKEEVTDEDVQAEMTDTLESFADYEHLMEVQAKDGDMVNIDYEGKVDGEAFDGGTDFDTLVTIGEGLFLEDFEKGIIGMTPGETRDVEVVFPEDYTEDLAGKTAVFSITLNFICGEEIVPELTDESVKEYLGFESVAAFEEDTRKGLEEDAQDIFTYEIEDDLMEQLLENCEVKEVPQDKIDQDVQETVEMYKSYAEMFGMDYEEFLLQMGAGDEKSFLGQLEEEARLYETQSIILAKIAELENIGLDDEAYEEYLVQLAEEYGYETVDDLKEEIEATAGLKENLRARRVEELVKEWLLDHAVYVEAEEEEEEPDLIWDEEEDEEPLDEDEILVEDEDLDEIDAEAEAIEEESSEAATE